MADRNSSTAERFTKSLSTPGPNGASTTLPRARPPLARSLTRAQSIRESVQHGASTFFGVSPDEHKWAQRRLRHCSRRYGQIRPLDSFVTTPRSLAYSFDGRSLSLETRPRRDSVAKMAWDGFNTLVRSGGATVKRHPTFSRSFQAHYQPGIDSVDGSVVGGSTAPPSAAPALPTPIAGTQMQPISEEEHALSLDKLQDDVFFDDLPLPFQATPTPSSAPPRPQLRSVISSTTMPDGSALPMPRGYGTRKVSATAAKMSKWPKLFQKLIPQPTKNANRKKSLGLAARLFSRKKSVDFDLVKQRWDSLEDHRPYFTYWLCFVQVLICIVAQSIYGFGPFGFGRVRRTDMVRQTSLVLEQVAYFEQENFWLGPRYADLVRLGAKYSPCMRRDANIWTTIASERKAESETGCCVRHDRSGCVQAGRDDCSSTLAAWIKWGKKGMLRGPNGRQAGAVCGQDPQTCANPASQGATVWPDDLTQWPVCTTTSDDIDEKLPHMTCEVTGRPCCIGINGQCRITTREYCTFVKGYFHKEATLCSQVSCLQEVCGMIPFVDPKRPDQLQRLFTSLFLHAGVIHLVCSLLIEVFLMPDLEKLVGCARLALVFFVSGIGGNLASAVFVPYQAEVGPSGAHFGMLASLVVDFLYSWSFIARPWRALGQLALITLALFVLGLLPWIDNWAHAFGFVLGFLTSLAVFPYVQPKEASKTKRIALVIGSLLLAACILVLLFVLFYVIPIWECKSCKYFNCIPLTEHFCDNYGLELDVDNID